MQNLKWIFQPLSGIALGMLLVLNLTLYVVWYGPAYQNLLSSNEQLGSSLARSLAFESTTALHSTNRALLSNILNRFADQEAVIEASVTSEEEGGIRLSSHAKPVNITGLSYKSPIHFSDELLGYSEIITNTQSLISWKSQAITSWILFNLMSFAGLSSFIYWRTQANNKRWQVIASQLKQQLPDIYNELSGTPEQQLEQVLRSLQDPLARQGQLLKHLNQFTSEADTDRLLEQTEMVTQGGYDDIALVAVQCQNWDELIRQYNAEELQELWAQYENLVIRVGELYSGVLLPEGFSLAFGLTQKHEFALDSVCAARVLQLALTKIAQSSLSLQPVFGIAVSAGPAFISKTLKHGIPLPLITGDADSWLSQIKALQPEDQILFAEPLLQYPEVNEQLEASFVRDITLKNGQRLEIWELERLKEKDDLLVTQADTLIDTTNF